MAVLSTFGVYVEFIVDATEPAWHRNQRKQRQRDRGVLAAFNLGTPLSAELINDAAKRLSCHHGSSAGNMASQGQKSAWFCRTCKDLDGKPFCNKGFRDHCFRCKVAKGSCHGTNAGGASNPSHHTGGIAARQLEQQRLAQKQSGKGQHKEVEKLKKQNEDVKKQNDELKKQNCKESPVEDAGGDFAELLRLEAKVKALEAFGDEPQLLARTLGELKAARAKKAASIPEGTRLKRAEQDLAKRARQCLSADEEVAETKRKFEEAVARKEEVYVRKAEAEKELEEVRQLVGKPPPTTPTQNLSCAVVAEGYKDFLRVMPPDLLQQFGFSEEALGQFNTMLAKAAALQKAGADRKAAEDAESERRLAEQAKAEAASRAQADKAEAERNAAELRTEAPPASSVGLPNAAQDAVGSAASHLASAGPDTTSANLMDLCDSEQPEVAARARQTLSDCLNS